MHANLQAPVIFIKLRGSFPLVTDAFNLFHTDRLSPVSQALEVCTQPASLNNSRQQK